MPRKTESPVPRMFNRQTDIRAFKTGSSANAVFNFQLRNPKFYKGDAVTNPGKKRDCLSWFELG